MDITKCVGADKPKCETCLRKIKRPVSEMEWYFSTAPIKPDGECDEYRNVER